MKILTSIGISQLFVQLWSESLQSEVLVHFFMSFHQLSLMLTFDVVGLNIMDIHDIEDDNIVAAPMGCDGEAFRWSVKSCPYIFTMVMRTAWVLSLLKACAGVSIGSGFWQSCLHGWPYAFELLIHVADVWYLYEPSEMVWGQFPLPSKLPFAYCLAPCWFDR